MAALNFPSSPILNQIFTSNGKSWRYDGTSWKTFYVLGVPSGGTGNTSYNLGDLLVGAGTSMFALPIGSNGYVLTVDNTEPFLLSWKPTSATGITTLNGISAGLQYLVTGSSGTSFNIASSGSTHTFNIPIAGTGSTGLVSTLAQSFAGVKTFTSDTIISSSTVSTSTASGALTITGGVGIGGSLYVSSASNISGIVLNNSVITSGSWAGSLITGLYGGTGYNSYTKGDILVGSGSTFIKLPVGADGYVLGADSSRPSGLGWTTVSAVSVSDSAPPAPKPADLWYNSLDGGLLIYYADGTSSQWTEINLGSGVDLTQQINITNTTNSTSTTSGALVINGGLGVSGDIYANSFNISNFNSLQAGIFTASSTTANQVAFTFSSSSYRSAKIWVQTSSPSSYQIDEIVAIHNGSSAFITQFASVDTAGIASTFDADISGGNFRLLVTPTLSNTTYNISCLGIRA